MNMSWVKTASVLLVFPIAFTLFGLTLSAIIESYYEGISCGHPCIGPSDMIIPSFVLLGFIMGIVGAIRKHRAQPLKNVLAVAVVICIALVIISFGLFLPAPT
jgi:uncharacterized membrane protein